MDFGDYIIIFGGIALLSGLSCKNMAIGMIEQLNIVTRYYPKHYTAPSRWMRKLFKLSQRVIPRYLYFELLLSLFFFLLGAVNIVVSVAGGGNETRTVILVMFHVGAIILNAIFFCTMSLLYQYAHPKK